MQFSVAIERAWTTKEVINFGGDPDYRSPAPVYTQ